MKVLRNERFDTLLPPSSNMTQYNRVMFKIAQIKICFNNWKTMHLLIVSDCEQESYVKGNFGSVFIFFVFDVDS